MQQYKLLTVLVQTYITGTSAAKIASSIEAALNSGRVTPGTLLPPVRRTAEALGVSAATVAAAYRLLRDRGIVVADGRRGTRVRRGSPIAAAGRFLPLPGGVRDLASGNPDPQLLPVLHLKNVRQRLYNEELNNRALIDLARSLFEADGIPAENVGIVSGGLDGIERVLRENLRPGDRVAVEDPCFTGIANILAALGLTPVPVALDQEGPLPRALRAVLHRDVKALIVMPRAQNPTGAAFTRERRRVLRTILAEYPDLLIIEDDHAGPVAGADYVTLIDASRSHWAVVRSMSKSLGPDLRLALLAADAETLARVEGRQTLGIRWVSHVLQNLVVILWRDPATARLLRRAAAIYKERREALITELARRDIAAFGSTGIHAWIPVTEEASVVQALLQCGWAVRASESFRIKSGPAIRITTAALEPRDAMRLADDLESILRPRMRASMT
jgi:DNA-binding transcriptional MocR family regulator